MLQEIEAAAARVEWSAIYTTGLSFAHPRTTITANVQYRRDPRTRHFIEITRGASRTVSSDCGRPKVFTLVRLRKALLINSHAAHVRRTQAKPHAALHIRSFNIFDFD